LWVPRTPIDGEEYKWIIIIWKIIYLNCRESFGLVVTNEFSSYGAIFIITMIIRHQGHNL